MAASFTTDVNMFSKRGFCGGQGGVRRRLLAVITRCSETSSASETLVHQTLRQLCREHKGQGVGGGRNEPGGSAYRMARNPGTAEETSGTFLRSQESSVRRGRAKVTNWSFISQISLSGTFLMFKKATRRSQERSGII